MSWPFTRIAVAMVVLCGLPGLAYAQHGGGHGGGGHASAGHAGSAGARTAHPRAARPAPGHSSDRVAVPRASVVHPRIDTHPTRIAPSNLGHLGFGVGIGTYGYRGTPYGYAYPGYYNRYNSGRAYGYARSSHARLRILDAPRGAQVFVDGYYAGIADDFDGVFQHLELSPGVHQIEIQAVGFAPIVFDVRAEGGRAITYRAQMVPAP